MPIKCPTCDSALIRAQAKPACTERFVCPACGEAVYVRCNYDVGFPRAKVFVGHYTTSEKIPAAKAYILLKRMLLSCTHFQLSQLEAHYAQKSTLWNLGIFYPSEVERIIAESTCYGLDISFVEAAT